MTKVTITIGCSGSGKSTWANSQNAYIIERDTIRESFRPGYCKTKPDSKFEQQVTAYQQELISAAIARGDEYVIISDTNLNPNHLKDLISFISKRGQVEIDYKYFDVSLDLQLCLTRNTQRERKVPEDVILRQWKQYQNLYNQPAYRLGTQNRPIVWVSDIHSNVGKLRQVFDLYSPETHQYVFNGDINDSRLEPTEANFSSEVSFLEVFQEVYNAVDLHGAVLLHSNHQKNLINLLGGRRKKLGYGLDCTAAELTWLGLELELADNYAETLEIKSSKADAGVLRDMYWWLATRPVQVEFGHNNDVYRCSHAWSHHSSPFEPFPHKDELNIYGPTAGRSNRIAWWEERDQLESVQFKSLCGHYHLTHKGTNCIVYDPSCGCPDGQLGYIVFEDGLAPEFGLV